LLPGRLGLRLDDLLSLGDPLEPGGAHQQDSRPLNAEGLSAAPEHELDSSRDARRRTGSTAGVGDGH
ncbi:hypothetical protein MRO55_25840, partial [Escherichia coli]|uniref:hypothetical protein n=1 Tax=Escherichia coli TaxID=562 RepID=UPI0021155826